MARCKKYMILIALIIFLFCGIIFVSFINYKDISIVQDYYLDENDNLNIQFEDKKISYCIMGDNKISENWNQAKNGKCITKYFNNKNIYIRNEHGYVTEYKKNLKLNYVKNIKMKEKTIYMALNDSKNIEYDLEVLGNNDYKINFQSQNPLVAEITDNGVLHTKGVGQTEISINVLDKIEKATVIVTDKITIKPDEYDVNKKMLPCGIYSKEDNDLLDTILRARVDKAGRKTRGGVIAAARFIGLEFPYRIAYFNENGRLYKNNYSASIDAEGRYYHEGLYLNESRFSNIKRKMHGPAIWGCNMYSYPVHRKEANGFDCSGFISWIVRNGGYDPGDIGAGITANYDFTDLGPKIRLSTALENPDYKIKTGDLLSGDAYYGGHIALLTGQKDGYYYVSESLWRGSGYFGAIIRKYDKKELLKNFYWQIDMDNYYGEEGIYTDYWN